MDTIYFLTDTIASKCIVLSPAPATTVVEKVATNSYDTLIVLIMVLGGVVFAALAVLALYIWLSWRTSTVAEFKKLEAQLSSQQKDADLARSIKEFTDYEKIRKEFEVKMSSQQKDEDFEKKIKEYTEYEKVRLNDEFELKKTKDIWEMIELPVKIKASENIKNESETKIG